MKTKLIRVNLSVYNRLNERKYNHLIKKNESISLNDVIEVMLNNEANME